MNNKLTDSELARYARHLPIPGFDISSQQRLKDSNVLVIGAGGLGCPALNYLAASGIGRIGVVDYDIVEESNLHRQILYGQSDIGRLKVDVVREKLKEINPYLNLEIFPFRLEPENAKELFQDYEIIVDGSDNFATRYLVNDACVLYNKINVFGAVFRFEGQFGVFNYPLNDGSRTANYRDLYKDPPKPGSVPNCVTGGVFGVLPGIIGSLQAAEVIKIAAGFGEISHSRVNLIDVESLTWRSIKIKKNRNIRIESLLNYDQHCSSNTSNPMDTIKEITVKELKSWKDNGKEFQLIDVREPFEREISHIGGHLIPLGAIMQNVDIIDKEKDVVIYCRSGKRSGDAILALANTFGFNNLYNLTGGILAWSDQIDAAITKY